MATERRACFLVIGEGGEYKIAVANGTLRRTEEGLSIFTPDAGRKSYELRDDCFETYDEAEEAVKEAIATDLSGLEDRLNKELREHMEFFLWYKATRKKWEKNLDRETPTVEYVPPSSPPVAPIDTHDAINELQAVVASAEEVARILADGMRQAIAHLQPEVEEVAFADRDGLWVKKSVYCPSGKQPRVMRGPEAYDYFQENIAPIVEDLKQKLQSVGAVPTSDLVQEAQAEFARRFFASANSEVESHVWDAVAYLAAKPECRPWI